MSKEIEVKRKVNLTFLLIALVLLVGCLPTLKYEGTKRFDFNEWHKDSLVNFGVSVSDTSEILTIGLTLHHGKKYAYSNLWLFLTIEDNTGTVARDTLEFFVARPDGSWLGRKRKGGIEVSAVYRQGVKLKHPGEYQFVLRQGMRTDILKEINSLDFWIQ